MKKKVNKKKLVLGLIGTAGVVALGVVGFKKITELQKEVNFNKKLKTLSVH